MLISIIIPSHNAENDIEECIESCINQTYKDIEIICIDNNSTDGTWQKLIELKNKYPSIIIDKELKQGASSARNHGLKQAKGEWIQFLDADDLLKKKKLKHQYKIIQSKSPDLILGASEKKLITGSVHVTIPLNDIYFALFSSAFGNTCSNLWKKDIINSIGAWNEKLQSSQEYDLMFRYIKETENVYIDKDINTIIRERKSSISNTNNSKNIERFTDLRIKIFNFLINERPKYFEQNKSKFHQALFDFIRSLYPYNKIKAVKYYNKYIRNKYKPIKSKATTNLYLIFYNILGFKYSEHFKQILNKINGFRK